MNEPWRKVLIHSVRYTELRFEKEELSLGKLLKSPDKWEWITFLKMEDSLNTVIPMEF